ncbi:MAG: SDR family NAD(P)-dependent oxidoreductase [Gammaproteobacteria bacterium]|nr:SDR family NAD(P)-dependent oxidoreductase [Gammaproteobacteria bacterium]
MATAAPWRSFVLTPAARLDVAPMVTAASRAGAVGVVNAEANPDPEQLAPLFSQLAEARDWGLKLGEVTDAWLAWLKSARPEGLCWALVDVDEAARLADWAPVFRRNGGRLLIETCEWDGGKAPLAGFDGWVVKGHEAGGLVGEETSFILLQKAAAQSRQPVYVHGGVGLHTAAACAAGGASGAIFDHSLLLLRESPLAASLEPLLRNLVGNETVLLGNAADRRYFRVLDRPGFAAAREERIDSKGVADPESLHRLRARCGWDDPATQLLPLGQDAALAASWAKRFHTVGRALVAVEQAVTAQLKAARTQPAFPENSPLARSHGTRLPIVQGPMTRVSDTAGFAAAVAEAGGLPMLALALMRGSKVEKLLEETASRLGDRPWGIGLLGFAPADLITEQVAATRRFKPAFALIAGGRPDQALEFERSGIPSYLHVPSPRLLSLFLEQGARRFVFEGRECGGHIGPLSSFILWEQMVATLLDEVRDRNTAEAIHVLFAGGIHDTRSAAMVATLCAPLVERGIRVGVLMGSAYLFTREIVASGSVLSNFQREALACHATVSLETGTGHSTRCADTPFARQFFERKQAMQASGASAEEVREELERLNLGRLRMASKGIERRDNELLNVEEKRQAEEGMYMLGQVATLAQKVGSVADLHASVTEAVRPYLQHLPVDVEAAPTATPCDIAIIGVGAVLPKAVDATEFWENVVDSVDGITEIPADRWDWRLYYDPDRSAPDKIYSKWGGFLADMKFDPMHYGIPPRSIKAVDPMQLMTLEVVRATLEDAGYADPETDHSQTSLILGASGGAGDVGAQYAVRAETTRFTGELDADLAGRLPKWTEDSFAGILLNVAAGRSANRFNFGGLNFTVDAACASSLTAIHQAVAELEDGRSDLVIAGGVDTVQGPFGYLCFSKTQALSPRGKCRTFDTSADGIVISEGIAMVALKRLADAYRDGDRVYAVIKGVGGSSDGRARSMTAPHPDGQVRALERAYGRAGYSAASVGMFEAHGTGTVAGDTAELETVTRILATGGAVPRQAAIGSVKTLIGHTKATAGVAGLIKSALALHNKVLPPHANVTEPNPRIADPDSPLYLVDTAHPWIRGKTPRRAAVSAFGFGGTNFHVTLEELPGETENQGHLGRRDLHTELLVWRGADRAELARQVRATVAMATDRQTKLRDLAFTLYQRLPGEGQNAALVVSRGDDLGTLLGQFASHLEDPARACPPAGYVSAAPLQATGKTALVFAGQGAQYPGMMSELATIFPSFRRVLDRADAVLEEAFATRFGKGRRLSQFIYPPALFSDAERAHARDELTRAEVAQPALGAVEVASWQLLKDMGLAPDMAAGHSYGEYVALYCAGVVGFDDLMRISEARGRFIVDAAAGGDLGAMAAVEAGREEADQVVQAFESLVVANHNAPRQCILSGPGKEIDAAVEWLMAKGIRARRLQVAAAFHSKFVEPARRKLADFLAQVPFSRPEISVYSNATASPHGDDVAGIRAQMAAHLVSPVEFQSEIERMYQDGARIFIGLGPKSVSKSLVDRILGDDRPHLVVRLDDEQGGLKGFMHSLAALVAEGVPLDLRLLFRRPVVNLDAAPASEQASDKHLWLLNGSGARPMGDPVNHPLTLEQARTAIAARRLPVPTQPQTHVRTPSEGESEVMTAPPKTRPGVLPPAGAVVGERETILAAYQDTMRQFLEAQERIMLAYLGSPTAAKPLAHQPAAPVMRPMAEEIQEFMADPEPPVVPAASIVPEPVAPQPVAEAPTAAPRLDPADLLLGLVEERTGYPRDMLALDQNMEADLGIDSIKRVEIVGALIKALPDGYLQVRASDASAALNEQNTLQGMIDWLTANGQAMAGEAAKVPFDNAGEELTETGRADLPRFIVEARPEPVADRYRGPLAEGVYLVTGGPHALAEALADRIVAEGARAVVVHDADIRNDHPLATALAGLQGERLLALIDLSGTQVADPQNPDEWRRHSGSQAKRLFRIIKDLPEPFRHAGRIVAASELDGAFGRRAADHLLAAGGHTGLLKSLNDEWPGVLVKAVDLDPAMDSADKVQALLQELTLSGGRLETGYQDGQRIIFQTVPANRDVDAEVRWQPSATSVILATGGARGITAEVLRDVAAAGATLVLTGRSELPESEEEATRDLDESALRGHLVAADRAVGAQRTPAEIDRDVARRMREREMRLNLDSFRAAGARVAYRSVDMRDPEQVKQLFDAIYSDYGRLDGIVHGAGIIEDRLLEDKSTQSFDRVFDTKVDSAWLLAQNVRQPLAFLVFFASVAGRYGNTGQTDYAAANEVLNRMAWQLSRQWPETRVVSINWGPWLGTRYGKGMVSPETRRKFESRGVTLVGPDAGRELFMYEITRAPSSQVEVIAGEGPWEQHEADMGRLVAVNGPVEETAFSLLDLGEAKVGAAGERVLTRHVDTRRDPYLAEHLIDDTPVLPAAVALEMLAEAAASQWPGWRVNEVSDLRVLRGIRLEDASGVDLEISLLASSHGDASGFSASAELRPAGEGAAHYRATIHLAAEALDAAAYQSTLHPGGSPVKAAEAYRDLLFHGPRLQTVTEYLSLNSRGVLASVRPTTPGAWLDRPGEWLFDPGMVDAAPQVALVWAFAQREESALPTRMGRVRRFGTEPVSACRMHFLLYPDSLEHQVRADVAFVDAQGNLRLFIEELECTSSPALNRLGGGWKGEISV